MGTPNKYKPEFCAISEKVLANGESKAAVCAELDIARSTLQQWEKNHPEFKYAMDKGIQKAQRYWESLGRDGISGNIDKFGSSAWIFTMKSRFRDDYNAEKEENSDENKSILEKIISGEIKINI